MFVKKLLQRIILDHRIKTRKRDREKRQQNKNRRLAKLLNITKGI